MGAPQPPPGPMAKNTAQKKLKSHQNPVRLESDGSHVCLHHHKHFLPAWVSARQRGPHRQLRETRVRTRFIHKDGSPASSKAPHKNNCKKEAEDNTPCIMPSALRCQKESCHFYMRIVVDNRKSVKTNKKRERERKRFPVLVQGERRKERKRYMKDP